ncbi:MAG: putative signal transducing protein [Candidatus Neomarinimicrobiota bacterium]
MTEYICIKTYPDRQRAQIDKAFLESHGIAAVIHADDLGGMAPGLAFGSKGVRLLVAEDQAEEALALLNARPETE